MCIVLSQVSLTFLRPVRLSDLLLDRFSAGNPDPVIHWTKDNVDMKEDHRIDIYSDRGVHHLEISDVLLSDHGLYAIHAENSLGTLTAECQIEVLENTDQTKRLKVDGLFAYGSRYTALVSFCSQPFDRTRLSLFTVNRRTRRPSF